MPIMNGLVRPKPEAMPTPPPSGEELDPDVGYFRRKAARLRRLGIRTIGPEGPPAPRPPEAPPMADTPERIAHRETVERELAEIDRHTAAVEARLAAATVGNFERQELQADLGQLSVLRAELLADLDKPVTRDRDGRPLTDAMRNYIKMRTTETREEMWAAAEKAASQGDHRRARQLRHDALRARHLAEHEMQIRPSLRGYSFPG